MFQVLETETDFEIYIDGVLFSWTERENLEHVEKLAALFDCKIEISDRDDDD